MKRSIPLAARRRRLRDGLALIALSLVVQLACGSAPGLSGAAQVAATPADLTPAKTAVKAPAATSPAPATPIELTDDPVTAELERFGVSVIHDGVTSSSQRQVILDAVRALAAKTAALTSQDDLGALDSYQAFGRIFGPTIIRIYQDRANVDGVHAALNCGWEGKFAAGCQAAEIYPEQVFPEDAWLILVAGGYAGFTTSDGGVGLYAHELVHNMTWGGGQNPSNIGGSSYVRYVGDVFAIRYMDYLGVQVGRDAYVDEDARSANPLWRAELTADAVSSWALELVNGPHAPIIVHYIQGMMVCELSGRKRC